jgi:hypothetical protein
MIRPPWAATIWSNTTHVFLELPSPLPDARSHAIALPNTPGGLAQALAILRARAAEPEVSTVSTKGAPTQRQVWDGQVTAPIHRPRKPKPIHNPDRAARIRALLRKEGMI